MTEKEILILRLVIAGVNGLFFTIGLAVLFDRLKFRPSRMRKRLGQLIAMHGRETDDNEIHGNSGSIELKRMREIKLLKRKLREYYRSPQTLLYAGFGGLAIALSLLCLMNLLFPSFSLFTF